MKLELRKAVPLATLTLPRLQQLVRAIGRQQDLPPDFTCSVAVVSDSVMRRLNRDFRQKDKPTDVLSFRYSEEVGEIMISAQRARVQARRYGHRLVDESAWLFVHGFLHLLGWDHERSAKEAEAMRALEQSILQPCGYTYAR